MRHARSWRRPGTPVGEVLSDRDDLPALRHRGGLSLPMGHGSARARMERLRAGGVVHGSAAYWLRVRLAQGSARLGERECVAPVFSCQLPVGELRAESW